MIKTINPKISVGVKVKPNAKQESVKRLDDTHFVVSVKAPPAGGKANQAVWRLLADYFGIAPSRVEIIAGHSARRKIIRVD